MQADVPHFNFRPLVVLLLACASATALLAQESVSVSREDTDEKRVLVRGWSTDELADISASFIRQYPEIAALYARLRVDVLGGDTTRLSFPTEFALNEFMFLLNYLHYPHGYDLEGRSIGVLGIASLAAEGDTEGSKVGFFYVPESDERFDQVFVETGVGQYFRIPFTTMRWIEVKDPRQSALVEQLFTYAK